MTDTALCYLGAVELLRLYRKREVSPVEVVQACLDRVEDTRNDINAVCFTYPEEALAAARLSEERYMSGSGAAGPLDGVPLALKDENMMAGKVTTYGSLLFADHVADASAPVVSRLLDAGSVVHARTTTPEFSCTPFCHSRQWGITRNPWNTAFTPGGSSGGAGAALAAGLTPLATGSDIGGSIRIPASACGVVGFKPPYGRVPATPPFNLDHYNHPGPMARSVEDCMLMQNVLAGPHPQDITTLKPKLELIADRSGIKGWKIAYSLDFGFMQIDPEVRANTLRAIEVLASLGATVEEVDLSWTWDVYEAAMTHHKALFGAWLAEYLDDREDALCAYTRRFARASLNVGTIDYLNSLSVEGRMWQHFGPMMEGFDLFICPTLAVPAVAADFDIETDIVINGQVVDSLLGWTMAWPFNMLSRCPVLSVPSGRATSGVPTGIQIVGRTFEDQSVFNAAFAYEAAMGGWFRSNADRPSLQGAN
ncbi:amidase [Aureimonas sp. OT7]|uniref:amidase n=1 Tax=Aureimonas sp. OT7 TaxID=2816454 RepID=UPI0017805283|nr:amidase family protein [Aureimonas sp. OT7]QOG06044.1 amidase [Aureimonas sp. OT7]